MLNYRDYLSYADTYLLMAEEKKSQNHEIEWLLIPSVIMAWTAIESFVNNRMDDLGSIPANLELHEKAFLLEKRIKFHDRGSKLGEFHLEGIEYHRLEDKIFFLIAKSKTRISQNIKGDNLWQQFEKFKETRDAIIHPRIENDFDLSLEDTKDFIQTAKSIIQLISTHLWNKKIQF